MKETGQQRPTFPPVWIASRLGWSAALAALPAWLGLLACAAGPLDRWACRNPLPTAETLRSVTFANGRFLAVGNAGTLLSSTNGVDWTDLNCPTIARLNCVTSGNGAFVAAGADGSILASTNGLDWTVQPTFSREELRGVTHGAGAFVAVGTGGAILRSTDGVSWAGQRSPTTNTLESVTFGNGTWVAVGGTPPYPYSPRPTHALLTSSDGVNWQDRSEDTPQTTYQWGVAYGNGRFVSVGYAGTVLTSPDGAAWTLRQIGWNHFYGVVFAKDRFAAFHNRYAPFPWGSRSELLTSPDGEQWTTNARASGSGEDLYGLAYGNGTFVLTTAKSILTSNDEEDWVCQTKGETAMITSVAYGNGRFLAANGAALTSLDGRAWETHPTPEEIHYVIAGGGAFVAASRSSILTSPDGVTWTTAWHSAQEPFINAAMAYGNGTFIVAGQALVTSSDGGLHWTSPVEGQTFDIRSIAYGNGLFVGIDAFSNRVWTSPDGTDWSTQPMADLRHLTFGNGRFVAFGYMEGAEGVYSSSDGQHWAPLAKLNPNLVNSIAHSPVYGNGLFAGLRYWEPVSVCITSPDGAAWTVHPLHSPGPLTAPLLALCYGNNTFVAVGDGGRIFQSAPVGAPYQVSVHADYDTAVVPGTESGLIRVSRTGDNALGIGLTVNLALSGTAQPGIDYRAFENAISIPAGQSSVTIPVIAEGALGPASTRTLVVAVAPGEAYEIGEPFSAAVTVENPGPNPRFRRNALSIAADGTMHLVIDSPARDILTLESSTGLIEWRRVTTLTNLTGSVSFDHLPVPHPAQLFYRVKRF